MSGFLVLHWPPDANPDAVRHFADEACVRLRQSHPFGAEPKTTTLDHERFWCVKFDTINSPSSTIFTAPEDGSWIFTMGSVAYSGRRVSDSALSGMLSDIAKNPIAAAKRLSGVFAVVTFDSPRQRILVVPSALGLYAVFVRRTEEGLVGISSSLLALTALGPVTLDEFTYQSLYRCGHRLPPKTLFSQISSVPEGCLIEVGSAGYHEHRYWAPAFDHRAPDTISGAAESVAKELTGYCASLIEPGARVFSDLTGGYDSRVSTASLIRSSIPFIPTVVGSAGHPDVLASRRICRAENLALHVADPMEDPNTLSTEIEAALLLSEGCVDAFTFAATLRAKKMLLAEAGARPVTMVSGGLGECYRDFFWAQEFLDRGKYQPASIERLIRYRLDSSPVRMDLFARDWHQDWKKNLQKYLAEIVEPYSGQRNTAQIDVVYLRKMSGMIGAFSTATSRFSAPLVPFSSLPALEIALSVPARWRYGARLLRHVAFALAPRFASYMTLSGCPCAPMNIRNWYRFLPRQMMQAERLMRKLSTVWMGRTVFPDYVEPQPETNPYAIFIDAETRPGGHLHWDSMQTADWYRPAALARLLLEARHPAGFRNRSTISRIYTCEAIVRLAHSGAAKPLAMVHSGS